MGGCAAARRLGGRPAVQADCAALLGLAAVAQLASLTLAFDVFNLFDREASDIDYFYESRPTPTAAAVEDRHFHPVEPRTLRVTASYRWF